jgi:hypothetical protein
MRNTWLLGLVIGAAAGGLFLTSAAPARAQDGSNGARFTVVQGSVSVRGANGTQTATVNMPVATGDYISSGSQARAEVDMNGATVVRLAGSVEAHVIDDGQIQLADGTVEVAVLHGGYGTTQIDTPSVTIRASDKGTYRISIVAGGGTQVTARSGRVQVVTPQRTYVVEAGKSIVASGTAAHPTIVDATAVAYDSFDQFGTDRDRAIAQMGQNYDSNYGYNGGYNGGGYSGGGYGGGYYGGGYGGYGYPYGYGWPVVVAAPVCGFGFTIGFGGFFGGCSLYPAIGFGGYYPWFSPYAFGFGFPFYGYGFGCCGFYGNCCFNGGNFYRPPVYYGRGWYRAPVIRGGGIGYRAPVRPVPPGRIDAPSRNPGGFMRSPIARAPIARSPIARSPIARSPIARSPVVTRAPVQHRTMPVRVARGNAPIAREAPIARTAPVRVQSSDPWRQFDNDRGTNIATRAPVAPRTAPISTRTAPISTRTAPITTRTAPIADPRTSSSDPWSRFTQDRGNVSMHPDPESRSSYGNPYRGNEFGGGSGQRSYDGGPSRGYGGMPSGGSRSPGGGVSHAPSAPSMPSAPRGGSGGGSRGGGRPPR